ncbi:MAG: hypothetical protein FWG70_08910 [Oscillospiraceae bacterium]|nr:hypothetical protein [Oscillospiraceae bacterium]
MNFITRINKAKIYIIIASVVLIGLVMFLVFLSNVSNEMQYKLDFNEKRVPVRGEGEKGLRISSYDYYPLNVHYPKFASGSVEIPDPVINERFWKIYTTLEFVGGTYAYDIVYDYKNRAELDYTVTIKEGETIVVSFFGFGYPEEGEPVVLDKEFIFDISDVSEDKDNLPVLISAGGEKVTDETRWKYYYSHLGGEPLTEKPEDSLW